MAKRQPIEIVLTVLKNTFMAFLFLLIAFATRYFTLKVFSETTKESTLWLRIFAIYSTIYLFIIFRALFGILLIDSKRLRKSILASYTPTASLKERLFFHITDTEHWLAFLPFVCVILIMPIKFGCEPIITSFFVAETPSPAVQRLIVAAITIPVFFLLSLSAKRKLSLRLVSNRDFFERNEGKINTLITKEAMMIGTALFAFAILIPVLLMSLGMIASLSYALLPTVTAFVLILLSIRYIRAVVIRAKFLRKLKKVAEDRRHRISEIRHPFRSLFFTSHGFHFTLTSNGEAYDCKLLCSLSRKKHIYFNEDGTGNYVRIYYLPFIRAGLAQELFRTHKAFRHDFESNNKKVLIVCPIPQDVRIVRHESAIPIPMGEQVGEYKVYSATTFLNAIERGVLDR